MDSETHREKHTNRQTERQTDTQTDRRTMLKFIENFFFHPQQQIIAALHLGIRFNHHSAHDVRTVRLVPRAKHTHDGSKMQLVVVTTNTHRVTPKRNTECCNMLPTKQS